MTGPALTLSPDAMRDVIAAAILQHVSAEERNLLIQNALAYLLKPQDSGNVYGRREQPSPLNEAFNNAARSVAHDEVRKMLDGDEAFRAKLRGLFDEAMVQVFETKREQTVTRIADAIQRAWEPER